MVSFKFNHLSRENLGEPKENISFTDLNIGQQVPASYSVVPPAELNVNSDVLLKRTDDPVRPRHDRILGAVVNLFTTIHDGNFRRHSVMNVTIK